MTKVDAIIAPLALYFYWGSM